MYIELDEVAVGGPLFPARVDHGLVQVHDQHHLTPVRPGLDVVRHHEHLLYILLPLGVLLHFVGALVVLGLDLLALQQTGSTFHSRYMLTSTRLVVKMGMALPLSLGRAWLRIAYLILPITWLNLRDILLIIPCH